MAMMMTKDEENEKDVIDPNDVFLPG